MKSDFIATVLAVVLIALLCGVAFFLGVSLVYWVFCFAFGLAFSWKIAIGVWAVVVLLRMIVSAAKSTGKK